ncbi:AUGMIN subunit 6-like isoform X3 [Prosopis cineraria]|uniref:AUGMIN subunit 6-like isoform X3 n=1 Tax=Prosopis cineraria TaxID=364024 RepID=UPI00240F5F39|nr:AUGMIN subunit 6-like isoform X3 [Prosopis cineraria]
MMMDREREREMELESAMYSNCLLLGLDPAIIGIGCSGGIPRVGLFRHSNPKLGEQLLYFILSSLRGPILSARDFDKVWPIFDSAQSRDFRKVVQGIISEFESQGALPRSNSRVSSLATCCGPRFVELLWQLSLHALQEVHKQTFAADVASNPLPAPLTDVAFSHAATLLPVTKARIALERRKFLKNAEMAVQQQAVWSNLAHEMTAEFRALCAEEAYLQLELEKLHDLRNKVKLEGELWEELVSTSSQNSHLVSKATHLWESLLAHRNQHEVLASGPLEDLIAHREHRYRISGSSLLAAMGQSSDAPIMNVIYGQPGDFPTVHIDDSEESDGSYLSKETSTRLADKIGKFHQEVDVAEVIWRWTHALQLIHKQSLHLAKANDGEGPDILQSTLERGSNDHAESLAATLAEHQQHLASFQVLINQLKEVTPAIQNSISECTNKVNNIAANLPPMNRFHGRSTSPIKAQNIGRMVIIHDLFSLTDYGIDDVDEVTSRISNVQIDKVCASPPTLKLPQLISLIPSSGKAGSLLRRQGTVPQVSQTENLIDRKSLVPPSSAQVESLPEGSDISYVQNLKRSVRETALLLRACNSVSSRDSHSDGSSGHFFACLSETELSHLDAERTVSSRSKMSFASEMDDSLLESHASNYLEKSKSDEFSDMFNDLDRPSDYDNVNGILSYTGSNASSDAQWSAYDLEDAQGQVFSPPLLTESSLLADSFEDLLAPLSETETARMWGTDSL